MKKIKTFLVLFFLIFAIASFAQFVLKVNNQIIMTLTTDDVRFLRNDLVSPKHWVKDGLTGKINKCRGRMLNQWIPVLRERSLAIPANDTDLVNLILSQPDYKNRVEREEVDNYVLEICQDSGKLAKVTCTDTKMMLYPREDSQGNPLPQPITDDCDIH